MNNVYTLPTAITITNSNIAISRHDHKKREKKIAIRLMSGMVSTGMNTKREIRKTASDMDVNNTYIHIGRGGIRKTVFNFITLSILFCIIKH